MEKFISKIYTLFQQNASVFVDLGLEPVKTMDLFRGQTTNPEDFEFFETPAIFIAKSIDWEKTGKSYTGSMEVDFHILTDRPWDTSNIFTEHEEAIKKTNYHLVCHAILDDAESEETGKLERVTDRDIDTGVVAYSVLRYRCKYYGQAPCDGKVEIDGVSVEITGKYLRKSLSDGNTP